MIRDTSLSDRLIEKPKGLSRRTLILGATAVVLLAGAVWVFPTARRWASADRSGDVSRLRLATISKGDLERDISVQGRIVATFHPTLFSPEAGTVMLLVRAGDTVTRGQDLARVDSPKLRSLLKQEEARLDAAQADKTSGHLFDLFVLGAIIQATLDDDDDDHLQSSMKFTLPIGEYTITEEALRGFQLTDIRCEDSLAVVELSLGSVTINLGEGRTETCTFINEGTTGTIIIVKDTVPNDGTDFGLNSRVL